MNKIETVLWNIRNIVQASVIIANCVIFAIFENQVLLQLILREEISIFKYHVFALMGRFQLELIYLYFPPSFHLTVVSVL